MIDLHNHMLPGLDDGPANWEESLIMARIAAEDGIAGVVCTPHWSAGVYENKRSTILDQMELFKGKLRDCGISLDLYPGSELRIDASLPKRIEGREVLTLNDDGRYALIELHEMVVTYPVERFLGQLISQGITPVIGHPERCLYIHHVPEELAKWVKAGALVQVTGGSFLGQFGKHVRDFTLRLLEHRLVHIVATDAHDARHRIPRLSLARQALGEILGEEKAHRLTSETPRKVLRGELITPEEPLPFAGKASIWKKLWRSVRA